MNNFFILTLDLKRLQKRLFIKYITPIKLTMEPYKKWIESEIGKDNINVDKLKIKRSK